MSRISVRKAVLEETGLVGQLIRQLAEYECLSNELEIDEVILSESLFGVADDPGPEVLVVESSGDNRIVGFSLYIHILPSTIHIEDLFVSSDRRKIGAGIALLSSVARIAISRRVKCIEWSCLDWNQPALDFYASLGAQRVSHRVIYRISGGALAEKTQKYIHSVRNNEKDQSRVDSFEKYIEAIDECEIVIGALSYTLSYSTFKTSPVILVTSFWFNEVKKSAPVLIARLISLAVLRGYKRIEIQLDPLKEIELSDLLVSKFGAIEMEGWIPFTLTGAHLSSLANRV